MPDRLMLLDTAALYFRAFHGVPDTVQAPDGTPVNAARGLLDIVAKLVTRYDPARVIACWDDDWRPRWRVDLLPSYKSHRVARPLDGAPDVELVPDGLQAQIPLIRDTLTALGIPIVGAAEHEADDVIGTLADTAAGPVDIVTGDRDLFQLIDDERDVRVVYTARGMSNLEIVTDAVVLAKYGVHARQYADFAAMRGDPSDGLPGARGIGDTSAASLLAAHGDLAGIVAAAEAGEGMPAGQRARILAARAYLEVAPTVVEVVRTLSLPDLATGRPVPGDAQRAAATALAARWNLDGPMRRAIAALAR